MWLVKIPSNMARETSNIVQILQYFSELKCDKFIYHRKEED